jgi:hypothetical protein
LEIRLRVPPDDRVVEREPIMLRVPGARLIRPEEPPDIVVVAVPTVPFARLEGAAPCMFGEE